MHVSNSFVAFSFKEQYVLNSGYSFSLNPGMRRLVEQNPNHLQLTRNINKRQTFTVVNY